MSTPEVGATVIGAGIAGLAAALELQRETPEVVVIDPADRPGGALRTDHVSGYVVERGANTVAVKAPMLAFLRRLGMEKELIAARPASRLRCIYRDGELLRVPRSPLGLFSSPLLSFRGQLRLLCEPLLRRGDGPNETVAEFIGRRLGKEAVTRLVGPFLTGVYAGDEEQLGAASVFPELVELEHRHRSLALGSVWRALGGRREKGLPGSWSAQRGLGPFARKLAERLVEPPALGSRVASIARDGGLWRALVVGPGVERELATARLVIATPAPEAAALLAEVAPEVAEALRRVAYTPVVGVPLGVEPASLSRRIEGFGFLVPRDTGLRLLGCLFMSQLFPGRAPEGRQLLHCMLGGARWPEAVDRPDEELVKQAAEDLQRTLGLASEPQSLGVSRWVRAIPHPDRGHAARMRAVQEQLRAECPGLVLAGAYVGGVAVADALASGVRAAAESAPV